MTTATASPIGIVKAKRSFFCTICGCESRRSITAFVYENNPEGIQSAHAELMKKATKKYTCNICKSIVKSL